MDFAKRLMTALRRPAIGGEYLSWFAQRNVLGVDPTRLLHDLRIGSFANFSEYHSAPRCLNSDEFAFLTTCVPGDGQIVDIGANIGIVTLVLANRYRDRVVHAIEPNPFTHPALVSNVALNRLENVQCHELAIADKGGMVLFNAHPHERATSALSQGANSHTKWVTCRTLDDFLMQTGVNHVSLLKVDVEGYEATVFRGAVTTLRRIRPSVIYFEVCPTVSQRCGFDPVEPAQILLDYGYSLHRLGPEGVLIPARPRDIATVGLENWVAKPSHHV